MILTIITLSTLLPGIFFFLLINRSINLTINTARDEASSVSVSSELSLPSRDVGGVFSAHLNAVASVFSCRPVAFLGTTPPNGSNSTSVLVLPSTTCYTRGRPSFPRVSLLDLNLWSWKAALRSPQGLVLLSCRYRPFHVRHCAPDDMSNTVSFQEALSVAPDSESPGQLCRLFSFFFFTKCFTVSLSSRPPQVLWCISRCISSSISIHPLPRSPSL